MAEPVLRYREDAAHEAVVVSFAEFAGETNATAVRVEPGDDVRALLPHLDRLALVEVSFPSHTDGRGYSSARILREQGYKGELRAVGEVLIDQFSHLTRCGFDGFVPSLPVTREAADKARATWGEVYQMTVDGRSPIWAKRHG